MNEPGPPETGPAAAPAATLSLPCSPEAMPSIDGLLNGVVSQLGLRDALQSRLRLIVEELLTNLLLHGKPPADGEVTVAFTFANPGQLAIEWTDPGTPFDPRTDLPARPERGPKTLEELEEQGLGWAIILDYCRIVTYARSDGRNRLRLELR